VPEKPRLVALVVMAIMGVASAARAEPSADEAARDHEARRAERWALYGVFVPIGAATVLSIATNPSQRDVGVPVLATIGGLWAAGGLWGTSVGYYRAGRPLYGTLSGLGKTALLGGCLLLDRRPKPAQTDHLDDTPPLFTFVGLAAVVAWDVVDYFRLGRVVREPPAASRPAAMPVVAATSDGALVGLAGRF
jgi:hypothetical protein